MNKRQLSFLYDHFLEKIFYAFPQLREHIIFYFVSADKRAEGVLVPHRVCWDLVLVYGVLWKNQKGEDCVIPVTNQYMELWGVDEEALFAAAKENTPRLLPVCLRPMRELLQGVTPGEEMKAIREEIYVLTNNRGYLGAAAMLYEGVLRGFSHRMEADVYILPSSIHEVILLPVCGQKKECLQEMVGEINRREALCIDILSDSVYQYVRASDEIIL